MVFAGQSGENNVPGCWVLRESSFSCGGLEVLMDLLVCE